MKEAESAIIQYSNENKKMFSYMNIICDNRFLSYVLCISLCYTSYLAGVAAARIGRGHAKHTSGCIITFS